jgi:glucosamine 6-phosphate synthetase-like amidotransferase/phosphosugar isomerase protein
VVNYSHVLDILRDELLYTEKECSQSLIDALCLNKSLTDKVFIAAAGRSKMVASMFAMRLMHCGLCVYVVGEVTTPSITESDSLLIVSGSGETKQLITFAEKAKSVGAKVLLVTGSPESTLKDMADQTFQIGPASRVLSVDKNLPLGGRFELAAMIFLETVIINLMEEYGLFDSDLKELHANLE